MKNSIHIIILTLLLIFTAACGERLDERLAEVEAGMDANPDSVVTYLQSIKPESLINEYSRAQYWLMMTRARSKNHEILLDDSQICNSLKYFQRKNHEYEYMLCLYYKAYINAYAEECEEAMHSVVKAHKIAIKRNDDYWIARCCETMADIFRKTYNYPEEIKMRDIALDYYSRVGRQDNIRYVYIDKANAYSNHKEYSKAIEILDEVSEQIKRTDDNDLICWLYYSYIYALVEKKNYALAASMRDSLKNYNPYFFGSMLYTNLASISIWEKDYPKAMENIIIAKEKIGTTSDSLAIYAVMSEYYEITGDLRKTLRMIDSMLIINSHQIDYLLKQSGVAAQREILRTEVKEREWEARKRAIMLWVLGVGALTLAVMLYLSVSYFRERIKRKDLETSVCMEKLSSDYLTEVHRSQTLEEQIEEIRTDMAQRDAKMKQEIALLYKAQWSKINKLSTAYLNKKGTDVESTLLTDLEAEIRELGEPSSLRRFERVIDDFKDGLMSRFRSQCPELCTEKVLPMVILFYAQLTTGSISIILDTNLKTLYSRRTFLIKKIQALAPEDAEEFIAELRG